MEQQPTISITSDDGVTYEFESPDFECELLKTTKILTANNYEIVGFIKTLDLFTHAYTWLIDGQCLDSNRKPVNTYNLTPIVKPWYLDKSKAPYCVMLKDERDGNFYINVLHWEDVNTPNFIATIDNNTCRLATEQEHATLHIAKV